MKKTVRTPQQKKQHSYAKDRRNAFGENSKASRKNIPKSKAMAIRRQRHEQDQALRSVFKADSEDQQVTAETRVLAAKPRSWTKQPDIPLVLHVSRKTRRRARS